MNRFAGLALLAPYLRPHRGRVALALLSLLVAAGTVLAFGACLRALIDRGFAQGRPDVLNYALASLLVLAVVPVMVAPIIIFGRKVRALSREAQARVADMVSEGGETLDAVRTVQAFAQEPRAAKSFGEATERAFGAAISRISRRAVMTTLVIFIVFAAVGFLLWMGGHDVIAGHISAGDLSAFVFYAV